MKVDIQDLYLNGRISGCEGELDHRHEGIKKIIDWWKLERPAISVETGCCHNKLLHGHGMSTLIYGALCQEFSGTLWTVDDDETHISTCIDITKEYKNSINYHNEDSVQFLKKFPHKINFLFLDSLDFHYNYFEKSRRHALKELEAAWNKLIPGSIIVVDDCNGINELWFENRLTGINLEGKSGYVHKFLLNTGKVNVLHDRYQRIYQINNS